MVQLLFQYLWYYSFKKTNQTKNKPSRCVLRSPRELHVFVPD